MNKKLSTIISLSLAGAMGLSLAACGPKEKIPEGRTEISFLCAPNSISESAWKELVDAYNNGQGAIDKVYVSYDKKGSLQPKATTFTRSASAAKNVVMISDSQYAFMAMAVQRDGKTAPDGYFLDLTPYAEKDEDFQKNTIPDNVLNWWRMTRKSSDQPKHIVGAGQNLLGVPFGVNPHFNWYNTALFKAQGINLVSIPEEDLDAYNAEHSSSIKPHGYAEYKNAPKEGMTPSKNLQGDTVYKVFNDCIGMNWEEQRNLFKYFTPEYNPSATTEFGFVSEYWFNYGWSVGGDVVGYNGEDYDFTLLDKSPNYIVTKDNTKVGDSTYKAGEIVRYEDKVNQSGIGTMDGVYAIESQYNAIKEYVSIQKNSDIVVDEVDGTEYYGYGVASDDVGSGGNKFNNAKIAMIRGYSESIAGKLEQANADDFEMAVPETYREYEGGSVYYSGNDENNFKNEHLLVIGETYDLDGDGEVDDVYTGDIKKVDGTPIIGSSASASISQGLVIPACSDPNKYQASWDFISWVATDGQKYVAKTGTVAPAAKDTLMSDDFLGNTEITHGKNYYAIAKTGLSASRGDWGYFEDGTWVSNWSDDFNKNVRKATTTITLSDFEKQFAAKGKEDVNKMDSIIKGIR